MGASIVLPVSASYEEGASVIMPTNAVEDTVGGWDIPKVGIVAVGGLANAILNELAGRLPYLSRAIVINTEVASLRRVKADRKILLGDGKSLSLDLHAAQLLAQASIHQIADAVIGLDMVFLIAAMDGAVGTGIPPIVAQVLRKQDIATLAFVTVPFNFESQQRKQIAQTGIQELQVGVDGLITFSDGNIEQVAGEEALFASVSSQAALTFDRLWRSILNPLCRPGLVNIDFEDLRYLILSHEGDCAFGFGSASVINGAEAAALHAISHPLLGQSRLQNASAVLIAVKGLPGSLKLSDPFKAVRSIRKHLPQDPWIIYGAHHDDTLDNQITVSVLASGIRDA